MVEVEVDSTQIDLEILQTEKFASALVENVEAILPTACEIIRQKLWEITPKRTGVTAASWGVLALSRDEFYIWNENEPIATFLSEGTAEHWIEPVSAQALHWVEDGQDFFSKGHWVSGIEPMHLEERALEETQDEVEALIDAAIEAAIRESFEGIS